MSDRWLAIRWITHVLGIVVFYSITAGLAHAETERITTYEYDESGNVVKITTLQQTDPPVITALTPNFVNIGRAINVEALGENLLDVDVTTAYPGLVVSSVQSDTNRVTFTVQALGTALVGTTSLSFTTRLGQTNTAFEVAEPLPALVTTPQPIVVGEGSSISLSLVFGEPRPSSETYQVSIPGNAIATANVDQLTIGAGSSSGSIQINGLSEGATELRLTLADRLFLFSFPVFVAKPYEPTGDEIFVSSAVGITVRDTSMTGFGEIYSHPIGVKVGGKGAVVLSKAIGVSRGRILSNFLSPSVGVFVDDNAILGWLSPPVGSLVGALVNAQAPVAVQRGQTLSFSVAGLNLNEVTDLAIAPAQNISVNSFSASSANSIDITLSVDVNAAQGEREIIFSTQGGVVSSDTGEPITLEIQ